jgi:hypothetical protein
MTEDLVKYKEQTINNHFQNFVDAINGMNKRIDNALRDEQKKVDVGADFLQTVKAHVTVDISSTLGMTSSDKVLYAKMWLESKQNDINTLKEISTESQKSFLRTLDEQIGICRKELDKMQSSVEK